MIRKIFVLVVAAFSFLNTNKAQVSFSPDSSRNKNTKKSIVVFTAAEATYYAGSLLFLQNIWYKDREVVPFHFFNDNKGYLQVDKFGHAFGSWFESYAGYQLLRSAGVRKTNALIFGGTLGFILQTPIEFMDGTHEGWGFSWGDVAANAIGSGLVIGQEIIFDEQLIKYKFSYGESYYSSNDNGLYGKTTLHRILKNYNGHTYWLSMPVNKIVRLKQIPAWLDVAVGYGADGMYGEFVNQEEYNGNKLPQVIRYRQYLLSLDIDWSRIKTRSRGLRLLFNGLNFIKIPFPALEINSKGNLSGHLLYF